MPHRQLKSQQDCEDFVRGCTIMGIGGGGDPAEGLKALVDALNEGLTLEWINVDDLADDAWTASVYGMGSTAPISEETKAEINRLEGQEKRTLNIVGMAFFTEIPLP